MIKDCFHVEKPKELRTILLREKICYTVLGFVLSVIFFLNIGKLPSWPIVIVLIGLLSFIARFVLTRLQNVKIKSNNTYISQPFLCFFCLSFAFMIIAYIAYFPGGFNLDSLGQWDQAHIPFFNDWHPVLGTLIIWCVTKLCDSLAFYIFIQVCAFSLCLSCLYTTLYKAGVKLAYILIAVTFVSLSPATWSIMVCLYKDSLFAIFAILLFNCLLKIYLSDGKWIWSVWNCIAFITITLAATLIRHNGFFLTVPVLIMLHLLFKDNLKRFLIISTTCILLFALVKGPVYNQLNVYRHSNTLGESVGVPMAILGNELLTNPDRIDEETHRFLNSLYSDDVWKENYVTGEWDSVKWLLGEASIDLLSDTKFNTIANYTIRSILRSPKSAFESFSCNTKVVTQIFGDAYWDDEPYIEENEYGIEPAESKITTMVNSYLHTSASGLFSALFWNIGVYMLIYLFLFAKCLIKREYSKFIFIVPILIYNYGTMLLLSGPSYRYFYYNVPLFGLVLLVTLSNKDNGFSKK